MWFATHCISLKVQDLSCGVHSTKKVEIIKQINYYDKIKLNFHDNKNGKFFNYCFYLIYDLNFLKNLLLCMYIIDFQH